MALAARAAARAATGICALLGLALLAGCEDALGTSPPHAAPANPVAEGGDGQVELSWGAVTDATRYVILWDNNPGAATYDNEINDIEETSFVHEGLTNLTPYHYRIAAETSGGRGPESNPVSAIPGPVTGAGGVDGGHDTESRPHDLFRPRTGATDYRVYFAATRVPACRSQANRSFEEAEGSPHVRSSISQTSTVFYRVIAMNGPRIGTRRAGSDFAHERHQRTQPACGWCRIWQGERR